MAAAYMHGQPSPCQEDAKLRIPMAMKIIQKNHTNKQNILQNKRR